MAFKAGSIYADAKLDTKKWNAGLKTMVKATAIAGAAIAAAFTVVMVKAIKKANEFQKEMSNVSTLIDTTKTSTIDLTKAIIKMDPALGSMTELTKGLYQAFSAGAKDAEEALAITENSATFAAAALTDVNTAVDVLTTAVNAYGRETMDTKKASDLFFQTIKYGKLTGEELASSIGTSIPLYASAGIKLEELAAGMAAMTKQGVKANKATTQLNGIVNSFLKPSEEMTIALQEMGYESGSAFLKAEGLAGALEFVEKATQGDAAQMAALLPNLRGLRGGMALTGVGAEEFKSILNEMENAAGATDLAFAKQEKTFKTFKNTMDRVMVVTGNIGKHFVDQIAVGATVAANKILDFLTSAQGMEFFGNIVGFVAGTWDALKTAVQPFIDVVWPQIKDLIDTIAGIFGDMFTKEEALVGVTKYLAAAFKSMAIVWTVIIKTLKLIIIGIKDLIVAIVESGKTVGDFFQFLTGKKKWSEIKDQANSTKEAFKTLGTGVASSSEELWSSTAEQVRNFKDDIKTNAEAIQLAFTETAKQAKFEFTSSYDAIITGQSNMADAIAEAQEAFRQTQADAQEETNKEETTNEEEQTETLLEVWQRRWRAKIDGIQSTYDTFETIASTTLNNIDTLYTAFTDNTTASMTNLHQAALDNLDDMYEQGLITEEEYNTQKTALEETQADEKNDLLEKQFKTKKVFDIANVWIDAASAIMGWWAAAPELGPIAGPIYAGAMTGATLAAAGVQSGLIASQEFVPTYATGGMVSGAAMINEQGGEIISLPDGSQVIPNDISQQIASSVGGGLGGVYINIYEPTVRKDQDIDDLTNKIVSKLGRELRLVRG